MAELLAAKRSVNTRRAYEKDLYDFFTTMAAAGTAPGISARVPAAEPLRRCRGGSQV